MFGAGALVWLRGMVWGGRWEGGFRVGKSCTPMADSCWCMAKPIQYCKVKIKKERKDCDTGKIWRQEDKGMTEDEMVGWHHWLDGYEFEQAPGVGEGQGSLVCCSPLGHWVRHDWVTELNWFSI